MTRRRRRFFIKLCNFNSRWKLCQQIVKLSLRILRVRSNIVQRNLKTLGDWSRGHGSGSKASNRWLFLQIRNERWDGGSRVRVRLVEDIQNTANGSPVHQIRIAASVAKFLPDKLQGRGVIQKLIENSLGRH